MNAGGHQLGTLLAQKVAFRVVHSIYFTCEFLFTQHKYLSAFENSCIMHDVSTEDSMLHVMQ